MIFVGITATDRCSVLCSRLRVRLLRQGFAWALSQSRPVWVPRPQSGSSWKVDFVLADFIPSVAKPTPLFLYHSRKGREHYTGIYCTTRSTSLDPEGRGKD